MRTLCKAGLLVLVWAAAADSWSEETPRNLFNGRDFDDWEKVLVDPNADWKSVWSIEGDAIRCSGAVVGYIRTRSTYSNYRLLFDYKWLDQGTNNGLLVHIVGEDKVWPRSLEVQIQEDNTGDFWIIEGFELAEHTNKEDRRIPRTGPDSEKPGNEWNTVEVECRGDEVRVRVNGVVQNVGTQAGEKEGFIGFQSEGAPILYRNITLTPITQ